MNYVFLILCLVVIAFSSNWLVDGAVVIAKRFKISDFVIGAVIVGMGTSFPELVVSTIGAINGSSDIAIGNVVGSNIFNVLGILGLTAMVMPVAVSRENKRFDIPFCIFVSILTTLLVFNFFVGDGEPMITYLDGLALLAVFALFMFFSLKNGKQDSQSDSYEVVTNKQLILGIGKVVAGLAALIVSSDIFLENAISIAEQWGVSKAFIGITLVACGTSLPELAASITAAAKKNTQLALGNIIGSNIFNLSLILGVASQIIPLESANITMVDYAVMTTAAILPFVLCYKGRLNRWAGAVMFLGFVAYNTYLIWSQP